MVSDSKWKTDPCFEVLTAFFSWSVVLKVQKLWNEKADEFNQWDSLGYDEKFSLCSLEAKQIGVQMPDRTSQDVKDLLLAAGYREFKPSVVSLAKCLLALRLVDESLPMCECNGKLPNINVELSEVCTNVKGKHRMHKAIEWLITGELNGLWHSVKILTDFNFDREDIERRLTRMWRSCGQVSP